MVTFILLAALLIVAGAAAVAIPLVRRTGAGLPPAPWTALGATAVLVIGSAVLYATWSNWSWKTAGPADSPRTMVANLARRLDRNPGDLDGWLMLGRSYMALEQYPLAVRAYERADRISGGKNVEALVGQAEGLTLDDQNQLEGRAGRLLEQALKLDPNSGNALFFGAAAALHRGDLPLARERFRKVLSMSPPQNLKTLLEQQIAAIDQKLAGGAPAAAATAPQPGTSVAGDAEGVPAVRVNVQLSPGVSKPDSASTPLFVLVRDPAQPGPPLAVKRLESRFPQTVELTTRDSMIAGRAFAAGQKVQVVARISRSGNPLAGSGDPFGEVAYQVGHDGLVNIIINQVTP
jgi:cytochrome c-type biogenesis protein CcmH